MMRSLANALVLLAITATVSADPGTETTHAPACTATSSTGSGAFFDLRPDMAVGPEDAPKFAVTKDYTAKGYDYGKNFTLNICGSVVDPARNVVGVSEESWANVSAYYTADGKNYSIGSESVELLSRGRKLVLQYTGGSPCGNATAEDVSKYEDENATPIPDDVLTSIESGSRRKSATISFLCDRDPGALQASISFVGTDPDECAYFFEARSAHACAHAEPHKPGSVGPGSVFGLILVITIMVYLLGGIFYNRTVAHARGWRQLPNYSLWAGMWGFFCDMCMICLASCARRLPMRRGYRQLNTSPTRRDRNSEAENRLIDQLDEEWDD